MALDEELATRFKKLPEEKKKRITDALSAYLKGNKDSYKEATRAMTDEEFAWMTDYFKGHISGE